MSVVIETTLGDLTVDLLLEERPRACFNFLKLCKMKYYNFNLFHTIERNFIAQTGDPYGSRLEGESIYGVIHGPTKSFFKSEQMPNIKHTDIGQVSFVCNDEGMVGSQFFFTLGADLSYLDNKHSVFGKVVEGLDVLDLINETNCDNTNRPYKDVRITHTVVLDDPYPDPTGMIVPDRSPSPSAERLKGGKISADENVDDTQGKSIIEVSEMQADREAKARATILEMVGDIPDAEMAPPENVLFVCKLNPATTDDDLEIIFSRFGKIVSCEVIRDKKTGDSLQYAFVEFDNPKSCEKAYFKMDNVLIDDRRVHVDFSQSVAKIKWHGKGRMTYAKSIGRSDFGKGIYRRNKVTRSEPKSRTQSPKKRVESPARGAGQNKERDTHRYRSDFSGIRGGRTSCYTREYNDRRYAAEPRRDLHRSRDYESRSRYAKITSRGDARTTLPDEDRFFSGSVGYRNDQNSSRYRRGEEESRRDRYRIDSYDQRNKSHQYNSSRDKHQRRPEEKGNDRRERRDFERERQHSKRDSFRRKRKSTKKDQDTSSSSESSVSLVESTSSSNATDAKRTRTEKRYSSSDSKPRHERDHSSTD